MKKYKKGKIIIDFKDDYGNICVYNDFIKDTKSFEHCVEINTSKSSMYTHIEVGSIIRDLIKDYQDYIDSKIEIDTDQVNLVRIYIHPGRVSDVVVKINGRKQFNFPVLNRANKI